MAGIGVRNNIGRGVFVEVRDIRVRLADRMVLRVRNGVEGSLGVTGKTRN